LLEIDSAVFCFSRIADSDCSAWRAIYAIHFFLAFGFAAFGIAPVPPLTDALFDRAYGLRREPEFLSNGLIGFANLESVSHRDAHHENTTFIRSG